MNLNMRYLAVLVSLLLITQVHYCKSDEQKQEIKLEAGGEIVLENPKFIEIPKSYEIVVWNIASPIGTTITLACNDTRQTLSEECSEGYFVVNYGDEYVDRYCGSERQIEIKSTNNRLTVSFFIQWYNAVANCKASATTLDNPTAQRTIKRRFELYFNDLPHHLTYEAIPLHKAIVWEFVSITPDYRVGLDCSDMLYLEERDDACLHTNVTINLGSNQEVVCKQTKIFRRVSDGDIASITLYATEESIGNIDCKILVTKGPHVEPWKNVEYNWPSDSEEGVAEIKGPKETSCQCGLSNKPKQRVLSDIKAAPHEFPWMATVGYYSIPFCGSSIITEYHVICAAHCGLGVEAEYIYVTVGINDWKKLEGGQRIQVAQVFHPNDGITYLPADISLIVLKDKITFNSKVGPICMPANLPNIYGDKVTVVGWGMYTDDPKEEVVSKPLMKGSMVAIDPKICNDIFQYTKADPSILICAWANDTSIYFGDSGGPLVWLDPETNRYTLVGVVAGMGTSREEDPSYYTSVIHFYQWMLDKIKGSIHGDSKVCTRLD